MDPHSQPSHKSWKLPSTRSILSSPGCLVIAFLSGVLVGGVILAVFVMFSGGEERPPVATSTPPPGGALIVQLNKTYLHQLIQKNVKSVNMPGEVKNVQLTLTKNGPMVITGDDQFSLFGLSTTRQFRVQIQPYTTACLVQVRILNADLQGIPVTNFVANLEGEINKQLRFDLSVLPKGFNYCATGVRTEPDGLYATLSATPQ